MSAIRLGIWMDHQSARLMEFTKDAIRTTVIYSKFGHDAKELALDGGENKMHTREQRQQHEFYKSIASQIRNYTEVVIFGPTQAKAELNNILLADNLFAKIKIVIKDADKMTENQQHAFVREFFGAK